jgi:hypothetical protein
MTKATEDYLIQNKLGNTQGIRELKNFLRLDAGIPVKKVNVMDIDQIVTEIIAFQKSQYILGC